jgi:quercetin dioxygenase-like cupin family protein
MATAFARTDGRLLNLPGRISREIASGEGGAERVTVRHVELAPERPGEAPRGPHIHRGFEEFIYVISGSGETRAESGTYALSAGDGILIAPGELHVTRNTGTEPLVLLCFFPVAHVASGTREFASWDEARSAS